MVIGESCHFVDVCYDASRYFLMSSGLPADAPQPKDINFEQRKEIEKNGSPLWRPVVDGACRQSLYLPSTATLAAVRGTGSEILSIKKKDDETPEGKGEKLPKTPRPLTPMGSLLLRTEY